MVLSVPQDWLENYHQSVRNSKRRMVVRSTGGDRKAIRYGVRKVNIERIYVCGNRGYSS